MVWYGGLRRLSDAPEDQTVSFPHPVDVLGCVENSYFWWLLRKIWLYKPPCKKKDMFCSILPKSFIKMTLGQIIGLIHPPLWYWSISTGEKIDLGLKAKCVFSSYFSAAFTFFTFLTGQKLWKFIWVKSDFWLHWTVSANFISKYTLKIYSIIQVW